MLHEQQHQAVFFGREGNFLFSFVKAHRGGIISERSAVQDIGVVQNHILVAPDQSLYLSTQNKGPEGLGNIVVGPQ